MPSSKKKVGFARLVDWVGGRLPDEEARAVEEQIAMADSATLEDVAWLHAFFKISEETVLQSPPPDVRDKLVHCFEAYVRENRRPPGRGASRKGLAEQLFLFFAKVKAPSGPLALRMLPSGTEEA
jgi:hypothetical protein